MLLLKKDTQKPVLTNDETATPGVEHEGFYNTPSCANFYEDIILQFLQR
jgi:hypothetical protein